MKDLEVLRKQILEVVSEIHKRYFDLAEMLYRVKVGEFYKEWGYETFDDYCEFELRISRRKGYYLVMLWDVVRGLPGEAIDRFRSIGDWTKAVQVARILKYDFENYNKWIDLALSRSYGDLVNLVNEELRRLGSGEVGLRKVEEVRSFSVKLYESEYDVVVKAVELAKRLSGSEATNYALYVMAMDFLASRAGSDGDFLESLVSFIEKVYGYRILVYKQYEDGSIKVIYGDNKIFEEG